MKSHFFRKNILALPALLVVVLVAISGKSMAQNPPEGGNQVTVNINHARLFEAVQQDGRSLNKLIGDVQLEQNGTLFYCDSAYIDLAANNLEAFNNVRIIQPGGTEVSSDYLKYTGNLKVAFLRGNVHLLNGTDNLWCENLTYNTGTKIGTYDNGGTLQTISTTLTSNNGWYNTRTKDSRFTGDVLVSDTSYNVVSDDLGYNTVSKVVLFYGPSVVKNDKSELNTTSGFYDSKAEVAHFTKRSSVRSGAQYVEGDTLDYDRKTGNGIAKGKVKALDTAQKLTLWSNHATVNEKTKTLLATQKPVLRKEGEKDTLYMRADTFFSATYSGVLQWQKTRRFPETKPQIPENTKPKNRRAKTPVADTSLALTDTAATDTTHAFIGFHHVLVFSDSMQARCDSISYTRRDSTLRLMINPVAWSRQSQITGDTLLLQNDSGTIRRVYVPANAFVASRTGPVKAAIFDQVQGKTLTGYFQNGEMTHIVVRPEAESIYYPKDDSGAYLGVNKATSERMTVFFGDGELQTILLEEDVKQKMMPIPQVNLSEMRLSRFIWREEERPLSVEEIFK